MPGVALAARTATNRSNAAAQPPAHGVLARVGPYEKPIDLEARPVVPLEELGGQVCYRVEVKVC